MRSLAAAVGMDSWESIAVESGKVVIRSARLVALAGSHWVVLDSKHRTSCMRPKWSFLGRCKTVEADSLVNKMFVEHRSGSYRTAKGAS